MVKSKKLSSRNADLLLSRVTQDSQIINNRIV
jgi:hypothetical protein